MGANDHDRADVARDDALHVLGDGDFCVCCSGRAEGDHFVGADGFGRGQMVPVCNGCWDQPGKVVEFLSTRIRSGLS